MPNSSLAIMYHQCEYCANVTIIAFQDENGRLKIGNLTSTGWTLTILDGLYGPSGPTPLPLPGTGLAFCPNYIPGLQDRIDLYYQTSWGNISLASWTPINSNASRQYLSTPNLYRSLC